MKRLPRLRAMNILFRSAHVAVIGALFGGHVFGIGAERLLPWLCAAIATGAALVLVEAWPDWRWCYQVRALMVMAKVALMCLVIWLWDYRVAILIGVIAIGGIGSHMPRWFRHYSVRERRVVMAASSSGS